MTKDPCPKCGSLNLAKYIYGLIGMDEITQNAIDEGRIRLPKYKQSGPQPTWHCNDCKHDWVTTGPYRTSQE